MKNTREQSENIFTFLMIVSGLTVLGVGVGFIFLATSSLYFLASTLVGVGLGLLGGVVVFNKNK